MKIFQRNNTEIQLFNDNSLFKKVVFASVGGFIAIAIISFLANYSGYPLIMGSFGASCVLLFGYPESPFSQPKNVIAGHLLSTFIGLSFLHFVGPQWWSMALALSVALGFMIATETVHPPAGSNPLIVFLANADWSFLIMPSFIGSIALLTVALVFINISSKRSYPKSWF
ncbi:MAG: HPP family protein [endosymbiont of Galathealinum brachiosum]|uniref:HPP family protein n=1 Tax=endosymbiont of Galathealinum brachiosum TaxID=2200906 RepID=A0A370DMK9_9GAMM|nr:MAG: HPP family protein [endosymbiont of Galathealinum brachiosum]